MLKPKPSINLNIFTIIDLGHAVYKEKKKQQLSFSQQETSGLAHSWSVRIKAKLAMPWGKNFPKVSMRRELPKGFCVFNSENTDSKTDRCEYRWHRHFGLEKQLFSSLEMGTHWSQGKQEPQGPVSFCRGPSGLGLRGVCWLEHPGWHQQLPEKWSCGVWTVCWKCVLECELCAGNRSRSRGQFGTCLQRGAANHRLRYTGSQEPDQSLTRDWILPWIAVYYFPHFNKSYMPTKQGNI